MKKSPFIFYQIFDQNKITRPKSYSLKAVAEYFKINREDVTHNALEDAKLTYQCFKGYIKLIPNLKIT
jgi:DNA polymerase III subunit epsilon